MEGRGLLRKLTGRTMTLFTKGGKMRERIYKALLLRYQNQMEEAFVKIDALLEGAVVPGHEDLTGSIDKLLDKVAHAKEKMAILRQYYGTN